jgi:hypothetical protein
MNWLGGPNTIGSASTCDVQFVMQREAQSAGKVLWLPAGEILPNETHVASPTPVLLHETGLLFSSDNLQLVRDEEVLVTLADGKSNTYRFSRRMLLRTSLLHIYVLLLRSRPQLTWWQPNRQIVTSFMQMV